MIIVLGHPEDGNSMEVTEAVAKRGLPVRLLDTRHFINDIDVYYCVQNGHDPRENGYLNFRNENQRLYLEEIRSIFNRQYMGGHTQGEFDHYKIRNFVSAEINSSLESMMRLLEDRALFVNRLSPVSLHTFKSKHLEIASQMGFRVPHTIITNSKQEFINAFHQFNGKMICKPVSSFGPRTVVVGPDDLKSENLDELVRCPVTLQEYIPGLDLRVHVVDDRMFAIEIHTESKEDHRNDPKSQMIPLRFPDYIERKIFRLASHLELTLTGIDLRRTPEGEYVFFEANPCPVFTYFEGKCPEHRVMDAVVDLLAKGKTSP